MEPKDAKAGGHSATSTMTPENARALGLLKIGVVVMGVIFIAGFVLVVGTLIYRAVNAGDKLAVTAAPFGVSNIHIDAGQSVKDVTLGDGRMAIHVNGAKGEAIILVDPKTGLELGRIQLRAMSDFAAAQP